MKKLDSASLNEGLPLIKLADIIGAILSDKIYGERQVFSIAPLVCASPQDVSYILSHKFIDSIGMCKASAIICNSYMSNFIPKHIPCLLSDSPDVSLAIAGSVLYPQDMRIRPISRFKEGIPSKVSISKNVKFEENVIIDSMVIVGSGVEIGSGTYIGPGSFIGPGVKIGRQCSIGIGVSIMSAFIGNDVVIHSGVRIGSDGLGYIRNDTLATYKMGHFGRVVIQDNVDIGVNSTIDRGNIDNTIIGENTKIGNQVQIGRDVCIGIGCIIASQVSIGQSVFIGDNVFIESQCGIEDYINIGDDVHITVKSSVIKDLPSGCSDGLS